MLDLKKMLENIDEYAEKLAQKKFNLDKNYFLNLNDKISKTRIQCQDLQTQRNKGADQIGLLMRDKSKNQVEIEKLKSEMTVVSDKTKALESELSDLEAELKDYMMHMPNIPDAKTPIGKDEDENVVLEYVGEKPTFDFTPQEHHILGEKMDIIDMDRGAKLSGTRFSVLKGAGARLEMAVRNFLFDCSIENGYTPVSVPVLVGRNIMEGTGQLPKFEEDMFRTESNGKELFLIPTAEVPVTNLFREEILQEDQLPIRYSCLSNCFRVEAGSAGKDVKGIFRQHQFDKVEMVRFATPEQSWDEFNSLVNCAKKILDKLNLHYRVVALCTGDLGFSACYCNDLEVWLPGQNRYREISSCSNMLDFQARRANMKYKNKETKKNEYIHTMNGSGMPIGRTIIAIMENYQQKDGSILIPEALKKYLPYEKIDANGQLV